MYAVPISGCSDEEAESGRGVGRGPDLYHYEPTQGQSAGADQLQGVGFEGVLPQALHRGADDGGDASGTERAAAEAGTDAKSGCEVIRIFDGKKNDVVLWRHKCTGASRGIEFGFLEETIGKRKWGTAFGN